MSSYSNTYQPRNQHHYQHDNNQNNHHNQRRYNNQRNNYNQNNNTRNHDPNNKNSNGPQVCSFFLTYGICRYGNNCTREHIEPQNSVTLLLERFYDKQLLLAQPFDALYLDIFQQMHNYGKILDLVVCENDTDHLRGNVYVRFEKTEDCLKAFHDINNKWYNKKPVYARLTNITRLSNLVCPVHSSGKACAKRNQNNEPMECFQLHVKSPSKNLKKEVLLANHKFYLLKQNDAP
ncbi:hypothetical protein ACO0RG_002983 [Hanseniaspora osmophila]